MKFSFIPASFKSLEDDRKRVAHAATAAVAEVGAIIKSESRSALAAGGFSGRFQNAMQVGVYPRNGESVNAAAVAALRVKYASVFEEGATIAGSPYLWLPLPNVPMGSNGRPLKPAEYADRLGKLVSINRPGHPPMLAGHVTSAQVIRATAKAARVRKKALKSGALQGKLVPLYIGVADVTDPKLYNISGIIERRAAELPAIYERNWAEASRG